MRHGFIGRTQAETWELGLISGNGRHGVVLWGVEGRLRLTVSHERHTRESWPPLPPFDQASILPELRADLAAGRARAAAERSWQRAVECGYGQETRWIDALVPALTIELNQVPSSQAPRPGPDQEAESTRSVDFRTGVATVAGREEMTVRTFVSRADDVVVAEIVQDGEPAFLVLASVDDGRDLDTPPADFGRLLARHIPLHADFFDRCTLDLGATDEEHELPAEELLADGADPLRLVLLEKLFDAARYAIISSGGELPPTLQGVWSGTESPPWQSGYTLDGNLQSALAGAIPTGAPELLLPLFRLMDEHMDEFRENARALFGCRGILLPGHMSQSHGYTNHLSVEWCLHLWTAGAGWIARFYYDYWKATGDRAFLAERAWPFLSEAALFLADFLGAGHGFNPSYSPENTAAGSDSQACLDATMDVAVAKDLLRNMIELGSELGRDTRQWSDLLATLPPYQIAQTGELAEWLDRGAGGRRADGHRLGENHAHRHASHLYPLWHGTVGLDPEFAESPALRAAASLTIARRLAWREEIDIPQGGEMAFGYVQLGLAAATLGETGLLRRCVELLVRHYWQVNLVPTHNVKSLFNVDIGGGLPALLLALAAAEQGDGGESPQVDG
jgi:alpha-L-fucosidase 2